MSTNPTPHVPQSLQTALGISDSSTSRVLISNLTHNSVTNTLISQSGIQILAENYAEGASHDSNERYAEPQCHKNTRTAILDALFLFATSPNKQSSLWKWLTGPAGSGKSTIARSLCVSCAKKGLLAASFFFKQGHPIHGNERKLVTTIAYQICRRIPAFKKLVEEIMNDDPMVVKLDIETQIRRLVTGPLAAIHQANPQPQRLIVIDGLDECANPAVQTQIVTAFHNALHDTSLPIRVLFLSRPERPIAACVSTYLHQNEILSLLDHSDETASDIDLFIEAKLDFLRNERQIPPQWPDETEKARLLDRCSNTFVIAKLVMEYISSRTHDPQERLELIIWRVRVPQTDNPYASLDDMYRLILNNIAPERWKYVEVILAAALYSWISDTLYSPGRQHHSFHWIFEKDFWPMDILRHLEDLQSLVTVENQNSDKIEIIIFHRSFADFLKDKSRSKEYHIDALRMTVIYGKRVLDIYQQGLTFMHANPQLLDVITPCYSFMNSFCDCITNSISISRTHHNNELLQSLSKVDWAHLLQTGRQCVIEDKGYDFLDCGSEFRTRWLAWFYSLQPLLAILPKWFFDEVRSSVRHNLNHGLDEWVEMLYTIPRSMQDNLAKHPLVFCVEAIGDVADERGSVFISRDLVQPLAQSAISYLVQQYPWGPKTAQRWPNGVTPLVARETLRELPCVSIWASGPPGYPPVLRPWIIGKGYRRVWVHLLRRAAYSIESPQLTTGKGLSYLQHNDNRKTNQPESIRQELRQDFLEIANLGEALEEYLDTHRHCSRDCAKYHLTWKKARSWLRDEVEGFLLRLWMDRLRTRVFLLLTRIGTESDIDDVCIRGSTGISIFGTELRFSVSPEEEIGNLGVGDLGESIKPDTSFSATFDGVMLLKLRKVLVRRMQALKNKVIPSQKRFAISMFVVPIAAVLYYVVL